MDFSNDHTRTLLLKLEQEVRQTLHHVLGMLDLAMEEALSPGQHDYLSQCRIGSDQLLQTLSDVGELASTRRAGAANSSFCLREMVEEVTELMAVLAERKGLRLVWSVDSTLPEWIVTERDTIQEILRRLLDNSIKFTSHGRVTLSVKPTTRESSAGMLTFEVADSGAGIAEIRSDASPSVGSPRWGLGMEIVRRRVESLGGELEAGSSAADGARLTISIPLNMAPMPAVKTRANHTGDVAEVSPGLRLLVAEDSDDSFNLFQLYVQKEGHHVSRAVNGSDAVDMVKENHYDLIVMDIDMPVMDGYTATRTIRDWETQRGQTRAPIILLSAESPSRQARIGATAGCSGYLCKPVSKDQVLKALNYFSARQVAS